MVWESVELGGRESGREWRREKIEDEDGRGAVGFIYFQASLSYVICI